METGVESQSFETLDDLLGCLELPSFLRKMSAFVCFYCNRLFCDIVYFTKQFSCYKFLVT